MFMRKLEYQSLRLERPKTSNKKRELVDSFSRYCRDWHRYIGKAVALPLGKRKRKNAGKHWHWMQHWPFFSGFFYFSFVVFLFFCGWCVLDVLVVHLGLPIAKWQRSSWRIIAHLDPPEKTSHELKEIPRKSCLTLSRIWKVWRSPQAEKTTGRNQNRKGGQFTCCVRFVCGSVKRKI